MNYIQAVILGLIQGFCEFLPVSSSGHLVIFQNIFGMDASVADNMLINIMLHFSTLIAVFIAFRKRIFKIIKAAFSLIGDIFKGKFSFKKADGDKKMVVMLILATLPLFVVAPFEDKLEELFSSLSLVGIALLITCGLLIISDIVSTRTAAHARAKEAGDATLLDSAVVGLFQCVALIPGISRSGSTITAGLLRNFNRELAVEFSFILSIPAVLGSVVLNIKDAVQMLSGVDFGPYIIGMLTALVSGLLAIKLVKYIVNKNKFEIFAVYCGLVGISVIVYSLFFN